MKRLLGSAAPSQGDIWEVFRARKEARGASGDIVLPGVQKRRLPCGFRDRAMVARHQPRSSIGSETAASPPYRDFEQVRFRRYHYCRRGCRVSNPHEEGDPSSPAIPTTITRHDWALTWATGWSMRVVLGGGISFFGGGWECGHALMVRCAFFTSLEPRGRGAVCGATPSRETTNRSSLPGLSGQSIGQRQWRDGLPGQAG
ncbi:hypothetical protein ABIE28_004211 [Devosia sp. 2618]